MGVPSTGSFNMFGTGSNTSIAGAISSSGGSVGGLTSFTELINASTADYFDPLYAGTITTPSSHVSSSLQFRKYPTIPVSLGEGAAFNTACDDFVSDPADYWTDTNDFTNATLLYTDKSKTIAATAQYYSNGVIWRYWNGVAFTTDGDCGIYGV